MARYIDKDKLVNKLKEDYATLVKERWFDDYVQGYSSAIDDVAVEPTADVQEVRHGKWITVGEGITERTVCSNCKSQKGSFMKPLFCNQCGAKMDGKE